LVETPSVTTPVISPASAFITTNILQDVLSYGTAKGLKKFSQSYSAAGKTGTTDDYRDAWFVGYTPQIVTGVWVGYDKPRPGGRGFTGGAVAAPIWERFMRKAVVLKPPTDFIKPDTVVAVSVDTSTGCRAGESSLTKRDEYFIAGAEPGVDCLEKGKVLINPVPDLQPQSESSTESPGSDQE
jgi:membrane carboxypeptidase/penicillin-binding protein